MPDIKERPRTCVLVPSTIPVPCQYFYLCRGQAKYRMGRGPFGPLWIHLCDRCARELVGSGMALFGFGADTDPAAVRQQMQITDRGLEPLGQAAVAKFEAGALSRQAVLDYLANHADDEKLLEAVALVLGGGDGETPAAQQHQDLAPVIPAEGVIVGSLCDPAQPYTCACGWTPLADHANPEAALRGHQSRCQQHKAARAGAVT